MRRFTIVLFACAVLGLPLAASAQDKPAPAAARPATLVNLNTATMAQLETLPGVGPKTAARIVEYRQKSGGFKKIEELMNVKGIGEKAFLKLKPQITVAPAKADGADGKQ
jgi:competence protein ComEA